MVSDRYRFQDKDLCFPSLVFEANRLRVKPSNANMAYE